MVLLVPVETGRFLNGFAGRLRGHVLYEGFIRVSLIQDLIVYNSPDPLAEAPHQFRSEVGLSLKIAQ